MKNKTTIKPLILAFAIALLSVPALFSSPITKLGDVPVDWPSTEKFSGKITAKAGQSGFLLSNGVISAKNSAAGTLFSLAGTQVKLSDFCEVEIEAAGMKKWVKLARTKPFEIEEYKAPKKPVRHADALAEEGKYIRTVFENKEAGVQVGWRLLLRGKAPYFTQTFAVRTSGNVPVKLTGLRLGEFSVEDSGTVKTVGNVPGSPVSLAENVLCGIEQPGFKLTKPDKKTAALDLICVLTLEPKAKPMQFSTMLGYFPKAQQRRAFNFYMERERAAPSQHFLHYNGWYDFAFNPTEDAIGACFDAYGKELTKKRGIKLDAVVLDDGWDNPSKELWAPSVQKFPNGFKKLIKKAESFDSNFGIWISPLGGYSGVPERIASCKKLGGLAENATKFDLADPLYKKWFQKKCEQLVVKDHVRYFKWDRAGEGVSMHFMNLLGIARELRNVQPNLYINVTVGTWPSPFWLNHVDCTWRDGTADVFWYNREIGDRRDQWLSFRDQELHNCFVRKGPLYPINSVMHHGIVLGTKYQGATCAEAGNDMKREIRSFFALGANLQEIYIDYKMLDENPENSKAWALQNIKGNRNKPEEAEKTVNSIKNAKWVKGSEVWDSLAESARWAQKHAKTLVDSHWVKGQPCSPPGAYATAAWHRGAGVIYLRNASNEPKKIAFSLEEAFELPPTEPKNARYKIKKAYADDTFKETLVPASKEITFELAPLQVLVLEATKQ